MQPFSPWPVRFCLVGVAGLVLGAPPILDTLTRISRQPAIFPQAALGSQGGDDRGSGRLWHPVLSPEVGFRGSGRVDPNPQRPNTQAEALSTAYRGSGRIQPPAPARA